MEYRISNIYIQYNTYGANDGKYTATVRYRDTEYKTEVSLSIGPEATAKVMALMADELVNSVSVTAGELKKPLLEALGQTQERSNETV